MKFLQSQRSRCQLAAANGARDRRDWPKAAIFYRKYLSKRPGHFEIWIQLGHALKESGSHIDALLAYNRALSINSQDSDLLLNLGHLHKLMEHIDIAIDYYSQSFQIDGNVNAKIELNRLLLKSERQKIDKIYTSTEDAAELSSKTGPTRDDLNLKCQTTSLSDKDHADPKLISAPIVGSLDFIRGNIASGWVWNPSRPDELATVEFLVDGRVVHATTANIYRDDVRQAGFGTGHAGFNTTLPITLDSKGVHVTARLANTIFTLNNSPATAILPPEVSKWLRRNSRVEGEFRLRLQHRLDRESDKIISIIMPVYNTPPEWLRQAINSVLNQWCSRWELICVNDASTYPHISKILRTYSKLDARIKVVTLESNLGIAAATNTGLRLATGELVAFMDHDDYLEPDAIYKYLRAYASSKAQFMYCDELVTKENVDEIVAAFARTAFSWDYYINHPYFVHMVCVERQLASEVGGWDEGMQISADVDFVLRCLERAEKIVHIPSVLYRWRTHESSAGHGKKELVTTATLAALNRHLSRVTPGAIAVSGHGFNRYRVDFPDDHEGVLIVIPTKNGAQILKACVESIFATTNPAEVDLLIIDHESDEKESIEYIESLKEKKIKVFKYVGKFNYSRINNEAIKHYKKEIGALPPYVVFMNNDIEAIEPGWLERMRSLICRPDVGVVGATLLYSDRRIQHSGVIIGLNGTADHAHKFQPFELNGGVRWTGYLESLVSTRDYSAVTAACMITKAEIFDGVGGFDERLEVGFNDTDFCLRVGAMGYKILNDANAVLYHHESVTRVDTGHISHPEDNKFFNERWRVAIDEGDRYYSPLFGINGPDHQIIRYSPPRYKIRAVHGLSRSRLGVP